MIVYSGRWLRKGEVWFDEEPANIEVDIVFFNQRAQPIPRAQCNPFFTLVIDLSVTPEEIFASFSKNTQYKIRRTQEQGEAVYEFWDVDRAGDALPEFCNSYNRFAATKNLQLANEKYLSVLANAGVLNISRVKDKQGNDLVWHVYYRAKERVCVLHTVSLFREQSDSTLRNFIGRANRFHHWQDMLRFKRLCVSIYDFGGWYEGDSDVERLRINNFKSGFGGVVVENHNCIQLVTLKARAFLAVGGWMRKVRQVIARVHA